MVKKSVGIVSVKLPASEFVDRFLISVLKLRKFTESGNKNHHQLQFWINDHQDHYNTIIDSSEQIQSASEELAKVHSKLWDLEDIVRSPEADAPDFFAQTAKQIFKLNSDRHKLKYIIDTHLPSMTFGPRLYDKGCD